MTDAVAAARSQSPWTVRERVGRLLWALVQATLFHYSLHNAYRWRAALLRLFGATVARDVRIRRTVRIEVPWHLTIGENTAVGDFAILYSLGHITIGRDVTVSQYAHLCAGTHDFTTRRMTLIRTPIRLEDDVWVAADAFVGPGVTIGARTVLGARAGAFSDLPPDVVAVGNPAKPIKARDLVEHVAAGQPVPAAREGAGLS
jgi:putative colanic acid biosynthesis acetyltransferase WcaF